MRRILALLVALCIALPMTPVMATMNHDRHAAMEDHGMAGEHDVPVDRQSQHICLGCAVPAARFEFPAPLLIPSISHIVRPSWPLADRVAAIDPPPPRTEG